ncbi:piwi-like protein Ago3 [Argiope bruennichi]|uniref:piwi-like protein Ago3 n=1 Tax=Argiope bruennichi TaxID=94029 RepID=UPI00249479E5|nr:piwi-like protein Ago3 [Argiope bruennichi]
MADKNPLESFGRGGRGALLLAALQNQPRRPGQSPPSSEESSPSTTDPPGELKPFGRGALLQSLIQARGRGIPQTSVPDLPRPVGRGRGLASILLETDSKSKSESHATSTDISAGSESTSVTPPTSEFERLAVGNYKGTYGDSLNLEVNYVYLRTYHGKGIYEYHVDFEPLIDSRNMKFRLMNDPVVKKIIGNVKTFDGMKLYLPLKLAVSPQKIAVTRPTDKTIVTVVIRLIKESSPSDCLHLYNLLFRKVMRTLKMIQVGRNYFNPKGGIPVPQHRLEIWPGYVTAVQEHEGGVMLNCDSSFRVLRTVTARDLMQEVSSQSRGGNVREQIVKTLIDCVVLTRYNNKTYKIDDINWEMSPKSTFKSRDGPEISFIDYYKRSYDIQINDLNQPLLLSKSDKKRCREGEEPQLICLIPELCFMTGLTDTMRSDFKVMKDIAAYTRVQPENRQLALQRFVDNVRNSPEAKQVFDNWNVELVPNPVSLEGRNLLQENLYFGGGVKVRASIEADWGRDVTGNNVLVPVHFVKWAVVFPKRDSGKIREFVKMLRNVCPKMGIDVKEPQYVEIHNDRTETYCEAIKDIINPTLQIVVAIFPTPRDDRYSAVKKLCCIEMPVPSQVINLRTISDARKLRSVVQKIALQMNCKLGGELWSVHIPLNDLMVCGMDAYHDNARGRRSVLAFVASINQNRTRWFSMTTMQRPGQEFADSLKMLFISALRKHFEVNHRLPEKIILFRDGVSDGQLDVVSKYEAEQLKSCFPHFSADYAPSLTVVVVQKRINTRIYTVEHENNRKILKNPLPGTILDHSITRKKWYDFFLVSQHVRQGTVTPTHYIVVYDSSNIKPDHMQRITYKMTHLYYNWPGTVRVPAPCQYAHKLAYLVGQNLHKETHSDLNDRLFYL